MITAECGFADAGGEELIKDRVVVSIFSLSIIKNIKLR
jgi:hypothetical protein